jgi:dihydrofolate reductase
MIPPAREPWVRQGGTTFTFVTDGIESALEQARAAASEKDIQISGGAAIVRQFIEAGMVDELQIHLAPVLLDDGVRLFDRIDTSSGSLSRAQKPAIAVFWPLRPSVWMEF